VTAPESGRTTAAPVCLQCAYENYRPIPLNQSEQGVPKRCHVCGMTTELGYSITRGPEKTDQAPPREPRDHFLDPGDYCPVCGGECAWAGQDMERLVRRRDAERTPGNDETVYGALARAEALAAGGPDWMEVTRWPPEKAESARPEPPQ
jgi:hypothetical protein